MHVKIRKICEKRNGTNKEYEQVLLNFDIAISLDSENIIFFRAYVNTNLKKSNNVIKNFSK